MQAQERHANSAQKGFRWPVQHYCVLQLSWSATAVVPAQSTELDVKGSDSIRKSCCWLGPICHLCPNTNSLMTAGRLYADGLGFVLVQVLGRELGCIP